MKLSIGSVVTYIDEVGVTHHALVTAVHGDPLRNPAINIVYVNPDENSIDQYGRQITRKSSIVHKSFMSANGNYWLAL